MDKPTKLGSPLANAIVIAIAAVLVVGGVWFVNELRTPDPVATGTNADPNSATGAVSQISVAPDDAVPAPEIGKPAAGFSAISIQGSTVTLSEQRGKPVWLIFGATWCTNCRAEAPDIKEVADHYGDDVSVIGIYSGEEIQTVFNYAKRLGLEYPQVADTYNDITADYRVVGLPTHFFIDAQGNIADIAVGTLTASQAKERLDPLV
jgi:thiol-disulfide isomerase/thioredoxin